MGSPCLGVVEASVWGSALLVVGFSVLVSTVYIAPLIEHEWSGPQHPAHGGVTLPGILFMTWLVFLSRMCCHKAS